MSVTDTQILGELQDILVEPNDGGLTWPSGLWTQMEVVDYLNQRQRRFLQETQAVVARTTQGIVPAVPRQPLPQDWVGTRRISYQPAGFDLFNGLVSFWRMNEAAAQVRVDSIGPNNLSDNNLVGAASGIVQGAASYTKALSQWNGRSNATQVGLNPGISNFAVSIWFFPVGTIGGIVYGLMGKGCTGTVGVPSASDEGYSIDAGGNGFGVFARCILLGFSDGSGSGQGLACAFFEKYTLNAWNHLVVNFNRTGNATAWLNGAQMTPGNAGFGAGMSAHAISTGACNPAAHFSLGSLSSNIGPPNPLSFFDGRLDAVGWWNRLLTADEIAVLWNGGAGRELFPAVQVVTPTGTTFQALSPGDQFEMDNFEPTWATSPQTRPWLYSDADPETLEVVILPPSLGNGTLHLLYVQQPTPLTGAGTAFSVPDEFVPTLKWGTLEDMLSKVGRAHDPIRAKVAGDYYQFGVEAAKALLVGFA